MICLDMQTDEDISSNKKTKKHNKTKMLAREMGLFYICADAGDLDLLLVSSVVLERARIAIESVSFYCCNCPTKTCCIVHKMAE